MDNMKPLTPVTPSQLLNHIPQSTKTSPSVELTIKCSKPNSLPVEKLNTCT